MGEGIKFISANCRGLGDKNKRLDVFDYMKSKNYSIVCLQDIHIAPGMEDIVRTEWGYEAVICPYRSNARGIGIFFNNNFEYSIKKVKTGASKGYVIIELEITDKTFLLVNLYGPNIDQPDLYRELSTSIAEFENASMIICGDWNLVLDPTKDTNGYLHVNNPKAHKMVLELINQYNLVDVWRQEYKQLRRYTYLQPNPQKNKQDWIFSWFPKTY